MLLVVALHEMSRQHPHHDLLMTNDNSQCNCMANAGPATDPMLFIAVLFCLFIVVSIGNTSALGMHDGYLERIVS